MGGSAHGHDHGHGHHVAAPRTAEEIMALRRINEGRQRFSGESTNIALTAALFAAGAVVLFKNMGFNDELARARKEREVELRAAKLAGLERAETERLDRIKAMAAAAAAAAAAKKAQEEAAIAAAAAAKKAQEEAARIATGAPNKAEVVFVLGGPGAGKGTMCSKIVDQFHFAHLSAGDLLRAELASGSDNAALIKSFIDDGKIVPVEITVMLIKNAMKAAMAADAPVSRFLVDGFPRNQDNLQGWNSVMGDFADVKFVLFMDCDEATMEKRCLGRAADQNRSDDNVDTIRKRFHTYVNSTRPIIDMFEEQKLVKTIDARPETEVVFAAVKDAFSGFSSDSKN